MPSEESVFRNPLAKISKKQRNPNQNKGHFCPGLFEYSPLPLNPLSKISSPHTGIFFNTRARRGLAIAYSLYPNHPIRVLPRVLKQYPRARRATSLRQLSNGAGYPLTRVLKKIPAERMEEWGYPRGPLYPQPPPTARVLKKIPVREGCKKLYTGRYSNFL